MFSQAEMNANKGVTDYNTPINAFANYHHAITLDEIKAHYGDPLDLDSLPF